MASIAAVASVAPSAAADTARVVSDVQDGPIRKIGVYSPSMRTVVYNQVIRGGGGAPTLFLLNGKGGGGSVWRDSWIDKTSYVSFFAGKGVNVVSPIVGKQAYLTDWDHPDPAIGVNKWETYLARELPGAINAHLGANGRNAIAGLSASGGPALDIGGRGPFVAAASYSGCPNISHPVALPAMAATIATGPAVPTNMYDSLAKWAAHDPAASPWRLRGKAVYIGSATGVPGSYDKMAFPQNIGQYTGPAEVEAFVNWCSTETTTALRRAGVPVTRRVYPNGSHTWQLFATEMRDSWNRVLGPALGR